MITSSRLSPYEHQTLEGRAHDALPEHSTPRKNFAASNNNFERVLESLKRNDCKTFPALRWVICLAPLFPVTHANLSELLKTFACPTIPTSYGGE